MHHPLISVLIPCHNASTYLNDCLDSLQRQTYENFEVVLVNDGSTDDSIDEIRSRKDKRFRIINQAHQGIVAALNNGIQHCKGQYIARMDTDDIMHPERLSAQLRFFRDHSYDLVGTGVNIFRDSEEITDAMRQYQDWSNAITSMEAMERNIFIESPIFHPTFFAEKALFQHLKGYRQTGWAEDYDLILRLYTQKATLGKLNQILLNKRDHQSRLSRLDERCFRPAMLRAKAHYFEKSGRIYNQQGVIIVGSGTSGKTLGKALIEQGVKIRAFVDNKPTTTKRTISGVPVHGLILNEIQGFYNKTRNDYWCLAVSRQNTNDYIKELKNCGAKEINDFCSFT